MKFAIQTILSVIIIVAVVMVAPYDLTITLSVLGQFFIFVFIGDYGSLHPVISLMAAIIVAVIGMPAISFLGLRLNHSWWCMPGKTLIVVSIAVNFAGYICGLFLALNRRRGKTRRPRTLIIEQKDNHQYLAPACPKQINARRLLQNKVDE